MDDKIIQIIPAPANLHVVYSDDEKDFTSKILCLGLTQEGDVLLLDVSGDGIVEIATSIKNFKEIIWKDN